MAAAFGLTEQPGWQDKYDITVYQLGWRLGGKGASGRNQDLNMRIEEHGLHIWGGFYENAFRVMRKCYEEMGRSPDAPLSNWQDAFKPHSFTTVEEQAGDGYLFWNTEMPMNDDVPGDGGEFPTLCDYLCMMLESMIDAFKSYRVSSPPPDEESDTHDVIPEWLLPVIENSEHALKAEARKLGLFARLKLHGKSSAATEAASGVAVAATSDNPTNQSSAATAAPDESQAPRMKLLHAALKIASSLPSNTEEHPAGHHQAILWLVEEFISWLHNEIKDEIEEHADTRHLWWRMDLMSANVRGLIRDEVILKGLASIDDLEWTDWLRNHGASEFTLISPMVRGIYDYVFGYLKGDTTLRACGAGTFIQGLFRQLYTYKGAIFWKMQAGMGDTVFSPFYEVLRRRGVKFKFFQRVVNLGLSDDKSAIAAILISQQVNLKTGDYNPLIDVKGLPCWPSTPLYDQIVEGQELKAANVDLESPWTSWRDTGGERTLRRGEDFDLVVLGISLGALTDICRELIEEREEWKNMVEKIQTAPTQAAQLWLKADAVGLGWSYQTALFSVCSEPINTWADMSHLIPREDWPEADEPGSIAYLCGLLKDADEIPPYTDSGFPKTQSDQVKQMSIDFLNTMSGSFWPNAVSGKGSFNWDLLAGGNGTTGVDRFESQFWRANISPSERYVLSVPGSAPYRLKSDGSGFDNLYLAGDWVWTSLNAGCVEAAVMGGLQASRAICGHPQEIIGDKLP